MPTSITRILKAVNLPPSLQVVILNSPVEWSEIENILLNLNLKKLVCDEVDLSISKRNTQNPLVQVSDYATLVNRIELSSLEEIKLRLVKEFPETLIRFGHCLATSPRLHWSQDQNAMALNEKIDTFILAFPGLHWNQDPKRMTSVQKLDHYLEIPGGAWVHAQHAKKLGEAIESSGQVHGDIKKASYRSTSVNRGRISIELSYLPF